MGGAILLAGMLANFYIGKNAEGAGSELEDMGRASEKSGGFFRAYQAYGTYDDTSKAYSIDGNSIHEISKSVLLQVKDDNVNTIDPVGGEWSEVIAEDNNPIKNLSFDIYPVTTDGSKVAYNGMKSFSITWINERAEFLNSAGSEYDTLIDTTEGTTDSRTYKSVAEAEYLDVSQNWADVCDAGLFGKYASRVYDDMIANSGTNGFGTLTTADEKANLYIDLLRSDTYKAYFDTTESFSADITFTSLNASGTTSKLSIYDCILTDSGFNPNVKSTFVLSSYTDKAEAGFDANKITRVNIIIKGSDPNKSFKVNAFGWTPADSNSDTVMNTREVFPPIDNIYIGTVSLDGALECLVDKDVKTQRLSVGGSTGSYKLYLYTHDTLIDSTQEPPSSSVDAKTMKTDIDAEYLTFAKKIEDIISSPTP